MRLVVVLLAILLAGCISVNMESSKDSKPHVSVSYTSNTYNGKTVVSATLKSVSSHIDDWSDLKITGCTAPSEGQMSLPHKFSSCSGRLRILLAETDKVLYDSNGYKG